jgi:hypothetical protein
MGLRATILFSIDEYQFFEKEPKIMSDVGVIWFEKRGNTLSPCLVSYPVVNKWLAIMFIL